VNSDGIWDGSGVSLKETMWYKVTNIKSSDSSVNEFMK
jgi:hypothetical protein